MKKYGTILVVDDNTAVLTAMKYCLADTFERVRTLPSPDNMLRLMDTEQVDIVLLDMNFSMGINTGQDGLFWLQSLRKRHPETPVVLMTAYADVQLAVKGLKSGAMDFIAKPWDNDELVRKLKDVMDANSSLVTLAEMEDEHIRRAVDICHGNMAQAAQMLGVSRQTLYNKMKALR